MLKEEVAPCLQLARLRIISTVATQLMTTMTYGSVERSHSRRPFVEMTHCSVGTGPPNTGAAALILYFLMFLYFSEADTKNGCMHVTEYEPCAVQFLWSLYSADAV